MYLINTILVCSLRMLSISDDGNMPLVCSRIDLDNEETNFFVENISSEQDMDLDVKVSISMKSYFYFLLIDISIVILLNYKSSGNEN